MNIVTTDKKLSKIGKHREFYSIINDIIGNSTVQEMKNFNHHCDTTCFEHCLKVAYYTYCLCKKFNLDYVSATRGAMLHDLFLYDWHIYKTLKPTNSFHAFTHPKVALQNAELLFNLNDVEKDVIVNHMWPVTISFPKSKEGFIITLTDKYSACNESFCYFRKFLHSKKAYKYAYVFLSLLVFRII